MLRPELTHTYIRTYVHTYIPEFLGTVLDRLAGTTCSDLKLKDPKRFHFDPRKLLKHTARAIMVMGSQQSFRQACASEAPKLTRPLLKKTGMCVFVCVCVYVCVRVCVRICTCMCVCVYIQCMHTHTHTCECVYV